MNLEPIIQSNVSQKDKYHFSPVQSLSSVQLFVTWWKYCLLMHIYGIQKDGSDDLIFKAAKETQTKEQTKGHSWGGRGWDDLRESY